MVNLDRCIGGTRALEGWRRAIWACLVWPVLGLTGCNPGSEAMWQQRMTESQAKIDRLSSQVTDLKGEVRESVARLEERDQKISALENEIRNRGQLIEKLEVDTKNLRMQMEALQKQGPAPK